MIFDEGESIGALPPGPIAAYLRDIGDHEAADRLEARGGTGQSLGFGLGSETYCHTGLLVGYLPPRSAPDDEVRDATSIDPQQDLMDSRIRITLDRFWVDRYPGAGKHKILCEFTGRNQLPVESEELRYAISTEARDRSSAAVVGAPIFVGASVGRNGISFEGRTINVSSDVDEAVVRTLDSGPFKQGLSLLTTPQPALKPFVGLASSIVQAVASRNRNKQVYTFKLGLDFEDNRTSAKLREGSFFVVQGDRSQWSWGETLWNPQSHQLVRRFDGEAIRFNYMVFGVSRFRE